MRGFFVFSGSATTEIYTYDHTLALHAALPICSATRTDRPCWSGGSRELFSWSALFRKARGFRRSCNGSDFDGPAALRPPGSALAGVPAVRQREVDRRAHRRDLRRVALLGRGAGAVGIDRSEEHTSELQSLMRISYAVFCLKNKTII